MSGTTNTCYVVRQDATGKGVTAAIESLPLADLPAGEVTIRVQCSSANYKDALAATGHRGVVKTLPHVPGIDAAGIVVDSASDKIKAGESVLVTGYDLGAARWGGWSQFIRVPADWVVPLPPGLTLRDTMILGTAGFTAAQCVLSLLDHGVTPARGPVVVTGATGGVGCLAVMLLAKLGYQVTAVSGKPDQHDWLRSLGAHDIQPREAVTDASDRPLIGSKWAGAVDTVGGCTLATLIRSLQYRGCVAACGLVGGDQLPLTVYPFLLRGVTLDGIDSAQCPYADRLAIWKRLAGDWKLDGLDRLTREAPLTDIPRVVQQLLKGEIVGRTLVVIP